MIAASIAILPAFFGQSRSFKGYEVCSLEQHSLVILMPDERQRTIRIADIAVERATVDTEVSGRLTHRICAFGLDFKE